MIVCLNMETVNRGRAGSCGEGEARGCSKRLESNKAATACFALGWYRYDKSHAAVRARAYLPPAVLRQVCVFVVVALVRLVVRVACDVVEAFAVAHQVDDLPARATGVWPVCG